MTKASIALIITSLTAVSSSVVAQNLQACPLLTAKNGEVITVRGQVRSEPHDMALDVPGCNFTVLATLAGYSDSDELESQLQNDRAMKQFLKYTRSEYKSKRGHICIGCSKYENVEADFTGKIEIAVVPEGGRRDNLGRTWDSNGKYIGILGWGHPMPFADYRLVVESVSNVKAQRAPKPKF